MKWNIPFSSESQSLYNGDWLQAASGYDSGKEILEESPGMIQNPKERIVRPGREEKP